MGVPYPELDDPDYDAKFDAAWKANFHERWPNYNAGFAMLGALLLLLIGLLGVTYTPDKVMNPPFTTQEAIQITNCVGAALMVIGALLFLWGYGKVCQNQQR